MKLIYDNGRAAKTIPFLDMQRVKSLSPKSAELRLINNDVTFQILLPDGYVDSEPVKIIALKKQPTISAIHSRFAPVNMPVLNAEFYSKLKPGTWLHDILVGDKRTHAHTEVAACRITYRNNKQHDCYVCIRPTTDQERVKAIQRAEARQMELQEDVDVKRAKIARRNGKQSEGRPPKDNPQLIADAIKIVKSKKQYNPNLSMKRCCELAITDTGLSIKWQALRKYVEPRSKKANVIN